MLTPEKIIALLNTIHEHVMARDIFVPVLKKMGLKGVRFTGGSEECGIDIEYYQLNQPDKTKSYSGIQFKKEDLHYSSSGAKGSVKEVKNQAEEAFEKELYDIDGRGVHYLTRFIVATTGDINEPARKFIGKAALKGDGRQIHYWDGNRLAEYIQNNWMDEFEEYFAEKIKSGAEPKEEERIIDSEYIEENYSDTIKKIGKVRKIVSQLEWKILKTVVTLEVDSNSYRVPMVDFLMEMGKQEDYLKEEFDHLIDLDLLDIDQDGLSLAGHASELRNLYRSIVEEMDEAEERDADEAASIFEEIASD